MTLCIDRISQFLTHHGVSHLFGVPGYANSPLFLGASRAGITPVLSRHESGASWMAYGYAQAGKKFGVCTGTSGAGVTNLLSGIAAAYANSVPVLALTGQVERDKFGKGAFQEMTGFGERRVDVTRLLDCMTKFNVMLNSASEVEDALNEAYNAMTTGRPGPAHICIPVDLYKEDFNGHESWAPSPPSGTKNNVINLTPFFEAIDAAEAPLILFGRGTHKCVGLAEQVASMLDIPYCTTLQAKGLIDAENPLHLGILGVCGHPRATSYFNERCDLLIVIGSSLNEFTTFGFDPNFSTARSTIRVDIDCNELEKFYKATVSYCADAKDFLQSVVDTYDGSHHWSFSRSQHFRTALDQPNTQPVIREFDRNDRIAPMDLIACLQNTLPADAIVTADSGNNAVWVAHYLSLKKGQSFLLDINTGCMGSGVVSAIGAKFAAPRRPVFAVCGDGGFMMNGMEVAASVEHQQPVCWVVMNDSKLGMVVQGDTAKYGFSVGATFEKSNIAMLGEAFGVESRVISNSQELESALREFAQQNKPMVLDCQVNDLYLPKVYARVKPKKEDETLASKFAVPTPSTDIKI